MGIVPKGPSAGLDAPLEEPLATVHQLSRPTGRASGRGYDPETGEEVVTDSYVASVTQESTSDQDVFTLVKAGGYSEERFYTRSKDANGHREKLQLWVPQGIDSQIYAAVSEVPEYRSIQDFHRDAAVHRLEFLQKRYSLGDEARRSLELERQRADREAYAKEVEELTATVADVDDRLNQCHTAGDWQMFRQVLEHVEKETLEWLREPYHSQVVKVLRDWKEKARSQLLELAKRDDE